jgi:hypothetical protein
MPSSGRSRRRRPRAGTRLAVGHHQEGLQAAQHAVGPPLLGQLDRRPLEAAAVLLDLGLELGEQGQAVGGGAREAGQDLAVVQAAQLARVCFMTVWPRVTWPSPAMAARPSLRTARIVVPWSAWGWGMEAYRIARPST